MRPGETVFVKTKEKLAIPLNILGRIAEKNSRMRQGLKVDGPHYQPGHVTFAFLRIQNISNNTIELSAGMRIAQIIFEELTNKPDVPYSEQTDAAFKDEENYRGLGSYKEEYDQADKNGDRKGIRKKFLFAYIVILALLVLLTVIVATVV